MSTDYEQPVLIIGAGPGGSALLEIFSKEDHIRVLGMVDTNPDAPGLRLAQSLNIRIYTNVEEALKKSGPCMVFNMTNDPLVDGVAVRHVGVDSVIGGQEAKFFWHIITRLQSVKNDLQENQVRMQAILNNVREGIISITPNGIIDGANPAIEAIFGYRPDELIGQPVALLMPEPHKAEHDSYIATYLHTGKKRVIGHYREVVAVHKDGHEFPLELSINEMVLNGAKHFVGLVRDITERKIAEQQLTQLAMYDPLTGLPNRTNFFACMEYALTQARRHKRAVSLLFIDLDGFKEVNDTQGHAMGDYLLKEVAQRLRSNLRESDTAARIGGDEFIVILNHPINTDEASLVAKKLIHVLNQPITHEGKSCCHVGASIGISLYPDHGQDVDELIMAADNAMYRAKAKGKNTYATAPVKT